jgi:hypothetical protein
LPVRCCRGTDRRRVGCHWERVVGVFGPLRAVPPTNIGLVGVVRVGIPPGRDLAHGREPDP